jgi:hypothetical protein
MFKCTTTTLLVASLLAAVLAGCINANLGSNAREGASGSAVSPAQSRRREIQPGRGWGEVLLGKTPAEIQKSLGPPDSREEFPDALFLDYRPKGIEINYSKPSMQADAIFFYNGQSDKPEFSPFSDPISRQITWSSSPEQVLGRYGQPLRDYKGTNVGIRWRRLAYPDISFRFENDRMVCVSVPGG